MANPTRRGFIKTSAAAAAAAMVAAGCIIPTEPNDKPEEEMQERLFYIKADDINGPFTLVARDANLEGILEEEEHIIDTNIHRSHIHTNDNGYAIYNRVGERGALVGLDPYLNDMPIAEMGWHPALGSDNSIAYITRIDGESGVAYHEGWSEDRKHFISSPGVEYTYPSFTPEGNLLMVENGARITEKMPDGESINDNLTDTSDLAAEGIDSVYRPRIVYDETRGEEYLLFEGYTQGEGSYILFTADRDGSGIKLLGRIEEGDYSVSSDGSKIIYADNFSLDLECISRHGEHLYSIQGNPDEGDYAHLVFPSFSSTHPVRTVYSRVEDIHSKGDIGFDKPTTLAIIEDRKKPVRIQNSASLLYPVFVKLK